MYITIFIFVRRRFEKIVILTRDCAGFNATIHSIIRTAYNYDIIVVGVKQGYKGLIDNEFINLDRKGVYGIINRGVTILKTSRC